MAKEDEDNTVEEVKAHDYELAAKIIKNDILPANAKSGEYAQESSTASKQIKKRCHIQNGSVTEAVKIIGKEESKRDDYLRGVAGLVNQLTGKTLLTFHGDDLVDRAEELEAATSPRKEPEVADA